MKIKKSIFMLIIIMGVLLFLGTVSNAATASITDNRTVTVGETVTVTGSANAGSWNLTLSGNGQSKKLVGNFSLDNPGNTSASTGITFTPSSAGTYTFSFIGDITDYDTEQKTNINKTCTITVKEKETVQEKPKEENNSNNQQPSNNSGNTNPTTGNTNTSTGNTNTSTGNTNPTTNTTNNKPKEPTFTSVNQTVYATNEVNVRSSYSASSNSLGSLKKGEYVTRIGVGSNGWSKVQFNGATAYISSTYLTTTKPEEKKEEKEEEKSTIKALKSLTIEEGNLSPEFEKETIKYELNVSSDVEKLTIEALPEDEKATVAISGNEELKKGENIVKVVVTAEDGTVRTYTIVVLKGEQEKIKLSKLTIKGVNLTPNFKPGVYEYTTNVENNVEKLDIKAVCDDKDATVEILGNESFTEGENTITIMLKSKDGKQNVTYQIIVNKLAKDANTSESIQKVNNNDMKNLFIIIIVAAIILLLIIIILIIRSIKKDREEDDELEFNYMDDIKKENTLDTFIGLNNQEDKVKNKIEDEKEDTLEENTLERPNKLYNVENEVDFSEDTTKEKTKARGKRKGKHF